jgi:hypothetical protein
MKFPAPPRVRLSAPTRPRMPRSPIGKIKMATTGLTKAKAPGAMPGIDAEADTLMHQVPGMTGHFQYK